MYDSFDPAALYYHVKQLTVILIICLLFGSCDPKSRDLPAAFEGRINITAKILNPRDSIGINDTVRIQFESLDTILYNGTKVSVSYGSSDRATCPLHLFRLNGSYAGSQGPASGSIIYAAAGSLDASKHTLTFQNNGNSLKGEYVIIPKVPGVYFLDQQLPGELSANNGQYKLDTYWNYGNINRNHQMLVDSAGASSNFNIFLQDRISHELEVYGFKVK